jgi:hypothetical protein
MNVLYHMESARINMKPQIPAKFVVNATDGPEHWPTAQNSE